MNPNEKRVVALYVIISLLVVVILIVLLATKKYHKGEGYKQCVCTQSGGRVCQNTKAVWDAYINGQNEFAKMTSKKDWGTVSPGDINFPVSQGCTESNCYGKNNWQKWDFDDFAD